MLNFSSDKKNIKLSFSVYYTIVFSRGPALVVFASKSIMPIFNNTFLLKKILIFKIYIILHELLQNIFLIYKIDVKMGFLRFSLNKSKES